jgi:hypothetical protein
LGASAGQAAWVDATFLLVEAEEVVMAFGCIVYHVQMGFRVKSWVQKKTPLTFYNQSRRITKRWLAGFLLSSH